MALSRRALLKSAGGLGALALVVKAGLSGLSNLGSSRAAGTTGQKPDRQWGFVVDLRRCDGCRYCTEACQRTHYLAKDQEWIKVYDFEDSNGNKVFLPRLCMQCENPPCLKVCPVRATFMNDEGVVLVDQDRCIGCRLCMAACPYEARYFNYNDPPKPPSPFDNPMPEFPVPQRRGTVGKCILCVHYTEMGRLPACVEACRMDALYIADLNSQVMTNRSGETYEMSRYLRENDGECVREQQQPDQARAGADLLTRVRRHDPCEDAPADRDHGDVRQRQPDERPVADQKSVSARDWCWPSVFAHDDDDDHREQDVGQCVSQKENDEAVQPVRRDQAAERAAKAKAYVGRDARNSGGTVAQLRRGEGGQQRGLTRK